MSTNQPPPDAQIPDTMDLMRANTPPSTIGKSPHVIKLGTELDSPSSQASPAKSAYYDDLFGDNVNEIPPTRFEIYPPLPKVTTIRRGGRGGGGIGSTIKVGRTRTMSPAPTAKPGRTPVRRTTGRGRGAGSRLAFTESAARSGGMVRRSLSTRGEGKAQTPQDQQSLEDALTIPPPPQPLFGGFGKEDGEGSPKKNKGKPKPEPKAVRTGGKVPRASFMVS